MKIKRKKWKKWTADEILKVCRKLNEQLKQLKEDADFKHFMTASVHELSQIYKKIDFRPLCNTAKTDQEITKGMLGRLRKKKYDHLLPKNWMNEFKSNNDTQEV